MSVSKDARSDIIDYLVLSERPFHGDQDLLSFLERVWKLQSMKAVDRRHSSAYGDIQTHVVQFKDWDYNYLLYDYLKILDCSDEIFLAFVEMCVSPLVVSDENQINEILSVFNIALVPEGYRLEPSGRRAGKTIYEVVKCEPQQNKRNYEVVLSFAGEDREYVELVADYLRKHNVRVFYDRFEEVTLWGKDLSEYLGLVYGGDARYCVMFISKSYAEKAWTTHEKRNALAKAIREKIEYIHPARFDNTDIPGLPPSIGYVDLTKKSPADLGTMILLKLGRLSH
jgi:hypothetical protein